jgi:hypothetical protein
MPGSQGQPSAKGVRVNDERASNQDQSRQRMAEYVNIQAELKWGVKRAKELAEAIGSTAQILARLDALRLQPDEAEPDLGR